MLSEKLTCKHDTTKGRGKETSGGETEDNQKTVTVAKGRDNNDKLNIYLIVCTVYTYVCVSLCIYFVCVCVHIYTVHACVGDHLEDINSNSVQRVQ